MCALSVISGTMIDKNDIKACVGRLCEGTDIFLVDVTVSPDNRIVVEIDSPHSLDIDTCVRITRGIEQEFDRDVEDYELEVGSAGLTAPFKVRGQYEKNVGRKIEVLTTDGRKLKGVLASLADSGFVLRVSQKVKEPGRKRPVMTDTDIDIPFDSVKKANVLLEF